MVMLPLTLSSTHSLLIPEVIEDKEFDALEQEIHSEIDLLILRAGTMDLLQKKRELIRELRTLREANFSFGEFRKRAYTLLDSFRVIGDQATKRDLEFHAERVDLSAQLAILQFSSLDPLQSQVAFVAPALKPTTEHPLFIRSLWERGAAQRSKDIAADKASKLINYLNSVTVPAVQFLHDAAILAAHDCPQGADPLGEDFGREYSVLLARNPKAYEEAKERMDARKEATPCLEETLEKIVCLGPILITPMHIGAASGGVISGLGLMFLKKFSKRLAIGIPTASAAAPAVHQIVRSIFEEASLKKEAALSKGDETVVYVMPKHDHNAMSHAPSCHDTVREFAKGRKLVVKRIDSRKELADLIAEHKNISHLWINLHGNRGSIEFDRRSKWAWDSSMANFWPQDRFAPGAQIILESCSAGLVRSEEEVGGISNLPREPSKSFAEELYEQLGKKISVVAPAAAAVTKQSAHLSEEGVSFIVSGEDVTVRFPASREFE